MHVLAALAVLLAVVTMSEQTGCGPIQRLKVKRQWAKVYGRGMSREKLGHAIWKHFFHHAQDARIYFTYVKGDNIHSPVFKAHAERVLSSLDMGIALLEDEHTLNGILDHLHKQHVPRNIHPRAYDIFIHSVLRAVEDEIGFDKFDKDSWKSCLERVTHHIRGANN